MEQPNLDYIDNLAGGDEAFRAQFIGILKSEFPGELETYLNAYKARDHKETAQIVHKLKHKFGVLGLEQGYALAVAYEDELLKESFDKHREFLTILKQIRVFLKSL